MVTFCLILPVPLSGAWLAQGFASLQGSVQYLGNDLLYGAGNSQNRLNLEFLKQLRCALSHAACDNAGYAIFIEEFWKITRVMSRIGNLFVFEELAVLNLKNRKRGTSPEMSGHVLPIRGDGYFHKTLLSKWKLYKLNGAIRTFGFTGTALRAVIFVHSCDVVYQGNGLNRTNLNTIPASSAILFNYLYCHDKHSLLSVD